MASTCISWTRYPRLLCNVRNWEAYFNFWAEKEARLWNFFSQATRPPGRASISPLQGVFLEFSRGGFRRA